MNTDVLEDIVNQGETSVSPPPNQTATIAVPTPTNDEPWIASLNDRNTFEVREYGMTVKFFRVKDPANTMTDKFTVFCKIGDNDWKILNGLLTTRYIVASTEDFVNALIPRLQVVGQPLVRVDDFNIFWNAKLDASMIIPMDNTDMTMFALFTGIDLNLLNNISTCVEVMVSNSYDGKSKLRLDYNINMSGSNDFGIVDYFSLSKFSEKMIHGSSLTGVSANITSIVQQTSGVITQLKTMGVTDDVYNSVFNCFTKEGKASMSSAWDGLNDNQKNVYSLSLLASVMLNKKWNTNGYYKIRGVFDKISAQLNQ